MTHPVLLRDRRRRRTIAGLHRVVAVLAGLLALTGAYLIVAAPAARAEHGVRHPVVTSRPTAVDWGRPGGQAPPVRYADIDGAWDCGGVLWVVFTSKDIVGGEQQLRHDDAHVMVQLLDRTGRSGLDGKWRSLDEFGLNPPVSGGEGRIRWPDLIRAKASEGGAIVDKARVVRDGVRSTAVAIQEGCP